VGDIAENHDTYLYGGSKPDDLRGRRSVRRQV
jgi:hypothetical protein